MIMLLWKWVDFFANFIDTDSEQTARSMSNVCVNEELFDVYLSSQVHDKCECEQGVVWHVRVHIAIGTFDMDLSKYGYSMFIAIFG
jgi:hypothetical protein